MLWGKHESPGFATLKKILVSERSLQSSAQHKLFPARWPYVVNALSAVVLGLRNVQVDQTTYAEVGGLWVGSPLQTLHPSRY